MNWPSREEWAANAERSVRHACYPKQRVSDEVLSWINETELDRLGRLATQGRLGLHRTVLLLSKGHPTVGDVESALRNVHGFLRAWQNVLDLVEHEAREATTDAVLKEIDRRKTDEAWERELKRRHEIDNEMDAP